MCTAETVPFVATAVIETLLGVPRSEECLDPYREEIVGYGGQLCLPHQRQAIDDVVQLLHANGALPHVLRSRL
jgi:hypothetical protein